MQLSAIFLISPVFIHLSVKELWVCDPPVGKAREDFLPGKAWLVGLAVLLQLGRSWGMDCCCQKISASVTDWIALGSPGLTSVLLSLPLDHQWSPAGEMKQWRGCCEQLRSVYWVEWARASCNQHLESLHQRAAQLWRWEMRVSQRVLLWAVLMWFYPWAAGYVATGGQNDIKPWHPQSQCKISRSDLTCSDDWFPETREKKGNSGGRGTGMLLETVGLLRPLIKSLYYCKDELAINSRMDRRQLRCKRMGPKTVFYYLGDFCLNRSFQSQHECWAVKLCPCRNSVFWWKRQINCFVTRYWTHSIALLVLKSERLHQR